MTSETKKNDEGWVLITKSESAAKEGTKVSLKDDQKYQFTIRKDKDFIFSL